MTRRRRKKRRDEASSFSLSFLDAISCGFGAIVMLLVLTKIGEPRAIEEAKQDLDAAIQRLEQELVIIRGETDILNREMISQETQLSEEQKRVARLQGDLSKLRGQFAATRQHSEVQEILEAQLLAAQQRLTEEMKRLNRKSPPKPENSKVGGVPVDSEYIIFVIDTSGSMYGNTWPLVQRKMREILEIYPNVKGIQIMNDMGQYMFSGYAGRWIPDTPGRRNAILQRLATWNAFSNSSPVEGIRRAIQSFARGGDKISIYVFGDEFTGRSVQEVLDTVRVFNKRDAQGNPRVRIHAVGFPVIFTGAGMAQQTGIRFAMLMRALCTENAGTFVGLNSTR
ncbi:hypothetical protein SCOR_22535 [Sulfidibacter corallicola]|uniref:VWA domain-containing protein n=1 Tax=Sulfidibacter corallicola TaxID=2818388 RepID=A0A8A4U246_SULCO|nr:vWA domain-containing protein [Sulfidibacter corallicola]QTD52805.1 hypothetical protein J3U87_10040 [Sulfidibacter corallicola]